MISMDLKQQILHYYRVDEMSLREIARRNGKRDGWWEVLVPIPEE